MNQNPLLINIKSINAICDINTNVSTFTKKSQCLSKYQNIKNNGQIQQNQQNLQNYHNNLNTKPLHQLPLQQNISHINNIYQKINSKILPFVTNSFYKQPELLNQNIYLTNKIRLINQKQIKISSNTYKNKRATSKQPQNHHKQIFNHTNPLTKNNYQIECFGPKQSIFNKKNNYNNNQYFNTPININHRSISDTNIKKQSFSSLQKPQLNKIQFQHGIRYSYQHERQKSQIVFKNIRKNSYVSFGSTVQRQFFKDIQTNKKQKIILNIQKLSNLTNNKDINLQNVSKSLKIQRYKSNSQININKNQLQNKIDFKLNKKQIYNHKIPNTIDQDISKIRIRSQNVQKYKLFIKKREIFKQINHNFIPHSLKIERMKRIHSVKEKINNNKLQKVIKKMQMSKKLSLTSKKNCFIYNISLKQKNGKSKYQDLYQNIIIKKLEKKPIII